MTKAVFSRTDVSKIRQGGLFSAMPLAPVVSLFTRSFETKPHYKGFRHLEKVNVRIARHSDPVLLPIGYLLSIYIRISVLVSTAPCALLWGLAAEQAENIHIYFSLVLYLTGYAHGLAEGRTSRRHAFTSC